jgi:hypothetical protein
MGCDIHVYTEVRPPGQLSWESKDSTEIIQEDGEDPYHECTHHIVPGRSYGLFALMAKVRGEYDCSLDCKNGLPEDISETTKQQFEQWDCDAHSASYLTLDEIKQHLVNILLTRGNVHYGLEQYQEIKNQMEELKIEGMSDEDVRICFWFDN